MLCLLLAGGTELGVEEFKMPACDCPEVEAALCWVPVLPWEKSNVDVLSFGPGSTCRYKQINYCVQVSTFTILPV